MLDWTAGARGTQVGAGVMVWKYEENLDRASETVHGIRACGVVKWRAGENDGVSCSGEFPEGSGSWDEREKEDVVSDRAGDHI
jgi:hypothetical protein